MGIVAGEYKKRSSKIKISGAKTTKKKFSLVKAAKSLITVALIGITLAYVVPPSYVYARDSFVASENQNIENSYINQLKSLSAWAPGSNKEIKQLTSQLTKGIGYNPLNHVIAATHYVTHDGKFESRYDKTDEISKSTVGELAQQNVELYGEARSFKSTDDWKNSGSIVHDLINDKKKTNEFISDMKKFVTEKKLKGFSIDFEGVWLEDRGKFVEFIREVKQDFGTQIKLSVCVPVQLNDNMNRGYDYKGIAESSDEVNIMNYQIDKDQLTADEGKVWKQIKSVVENPNDVRKFSDGLPLFAEINEKGGTRYPYTYSVEKKVKENGFKEDYRDDSGDAHFVYNNGKTKAIMMDSEGARKKVENPDVNKYCLYDLSYAADSNGTLAEALIGTIDAIENYNKQIIEKKKEEYRKEHPFKMATKGLIDAKGPVETAKALFEGGKATVNGGISVGKDIAELLK